MDRFRTGEVTIAYERVGSGDPVLFIHNGGTSRAIWREQIRALASDHSTIAIDLPGFGDSPMPAQPMTFDRYVRSIDSLIADLDLAPLAIVGNCMGSNIATAIASERAESITSLVLINPLTEATFSKGGLGLLHRMQSFAPRLSEALRGVSRSIVLPRPAARIALRYQLGRQGLARHLQSDPRLIACNTRRDQLPALVDVLDDMSAYGALDRASLPASVPVCTIWGSHNRVLSASAGEVLNERLRPERAERISNCGHLPMLEDPESVNAILREFLNRHRRAASLPTPEMALVATTQAGGE